MPLHPSITPIYRVYILNHKNPLTWNKTNHCTIVTPVPIMIPVSSQWGRNNLVKDFYILYIYICSCNIPIFNKIWILVTQLVYRIYSADVLFFTCACRRAQWPWRNSHFPRQAVNSRRGPSSGSNALTNGTSIRIDYGGKKMNTWNMEYYMEYDSSCFS